MEGEMLQIINLPKKGPLIATPSDISPSPSFLPPLHPTTSTAATDPSASSSQGEQLRTQNISNFYLIPSTQASTPAPTPPASSQSTTDSSDSRAMCACGACPPLSLQTLLSLQPSHTWEAELRALLLAHPNAAVGECGIDAAAVILGSSGASTKMAHQLAILSLHLDIAAELGRPVSMHCVRGYGPLLSLLQSRTPATLPPRIMLHSYGGSKEMVMAFTRLKHVGSRVYFSFSSVVNGGGRGGDKLLARIAAVPCDRLLLESDQTSPLVVDKALMEVAEIVAEARGWTVQEAQEICCANFREFYSGCT
ncbi:MAG: hypothetical protein WDW36_003073 [Sanguina aurantia]